MSLVKKKLKTSQVFANFEFLDLHAKQAGNMDINTANTKHSISHCCLSCCSDMCFVWIKQFDIELANPRNDEHISGNSQ